MSVFVPRLTLFAVIVLVLPSLATGAVERREFLIPGAYLVVEILDDDLVHFELSAIGSGPPLDQALYTSPMVFKTNYGGPSTFVDSGNQLETSDIRFVAGSIPELGSWNPADAIKLDPNIFYAYIHSPPSGGQNEGPTQPVWTGVVADLPSNASFE